MLYIERWKHVDNSVCALNGYIEQDNLIMIMSSWVENILFFFLKKEGFFDEVQKIKHLE